MGTKSFYGMGQGSFYGSGMYGSGQSSTEAIEKEFGPDSIVSFNDGLKNKPLEECVVNIEPVQDLHGYDAPWPAGGGKNKVDDSQNNLPYSGQGVSISKSGATYTITVNGATGYPFTTIGKVHGLKAGTYTLFGTKSSGLNNSNSSIRLVNRDVVPVVAYNSTFTLESDITDDLLVEIALTGASVPDGTYTIKDVQLESGSTATSWAPYTNVCPITGWTGAKVARCGKNLLNLSREVGTPNPNTGGNTTSPRELEFNKFYVGLRSDNYYYPNYVSSYSVENESISVSIRDNNAYGLAFPIEVLPGEKITFNATAMNGLVSIGYYGKNWEYTGTSNPKSTFPITETIPDNVYCAAIVFRASANTTATYSNVMVEVGSTATTYEPYAGQTYDIEFPAEAGSVYGGTLDVTNGVLTVDRAMETAKWSEFKSKTSLGNYTRGYMSFSNIAVDVNPTDICNVAPFKYSWVSDDLHFYVNGPNARAFVWLPNDTDGNLDVSVCYKLATPVTYQLTPQQITTLLGENNIWADTGDITIKYPTKVEYETKTTSGNPIHINDGINVPVKKLNLSIEPVQDLHGYDAPWPTGGGKNKINIPNNIDSTASGIRFKSKDAGIDISGVATAVYPQINLIPYTSGLLNVGETYTISQKVTGAIPSGSHVYFIVREYDGQSVLNHSLRGINSVTFTVERPNILVTIVAEGNGVSYDNLLLQFQCEIGTTATSWTPYSNICPITGWTGANIYVSPTDDPADGRTYSVTFPTEAGTVYGGTLDVTNGVLTVDRAMVACTSSTSITKYNTLTAGGFTRFSFAPSPTMKGGTGMDGVCDKLPVGKIASTVPAVVLGVGGGSNISILSSLTDLTAFKSWLDDIGGLNIVYPLKDSIEYTLTPIQISILLGENNVWADTGNVTLTYKAKK